MPTRHNNAARLDARAGGESAGGLEAAVDTVNQNKIGILILSAALV